MIGKDLMSETKVLYPKLAPLSVTKIFWLPESAIFFVTLTISHGAKNWPFFTFIILFVFAAAINKSVCLHKKAGICNISTWFARSEHCSALWISVKIGTFNSFLILSNTGSEASLPVFDKIKKELNVPILTDIHNAEQCSLLANHVDILQIPAFLCRQTDLLIAAAKTNKIINVKKGQFLAPWDMVNVTKKIADSGNQNILVTERGASFGYNTLVSDMRSLPIMAKNGYPVIFDATHSVQQPGGQGESSGGQREFVEYLARAAVAVGVAGVFIETHQDPDNAPSDGPNMVPLDKLENLLKQLTDIDNLIKK